MTLVGERKGADCAILALIRSLQLSLSRRRWRLHSQHHGRLLQGDAHDGAHLGSQGRRRQLDQVITRRLTLWHNSIFLLPKLAEETHSSFLQDPLDRVGGRRSAGELRVSRGGILKDGCGKLLRRCLRRGCAGKELLKVRFTKSLSNPFRSTIRF